MIETKKSVKRLGKDSSRLECKKSPQTLNSGKLNQCGLLPNLNRLLKKNRNWRHLLLKLKKFIFIEIQVTSNNVCNNFFFTWKGWRTFSESRNLDDDRRFDESNWWRHHLSRLFRTNRGGRKFIGSMSRTSRLSFPPKLFRHSERRSREKQSGLETELSELWSHLVC